MKIDDADKNTISLHVFYSKTTLLHFHLAFPRHEQLFCQFLWLVLYFSVLDNKEVLARIHKMTFDLKELKNDVNFIATVENLTKNLDAVEESMKAATSLPTTEYDLMAQEEKVKYDCYMSYTINSLYWMYTKLQGIDSISVSIKI